MHGPNFSCGLGPDRVLSWIPWCSFPWRPFYISVRNSLSINRPVSQLKCLFEAVAPLGTGVDRFLRWKEFELYTLLPGDEEAVKKVQPIRLGRWQPGSLRGNAE